MGIQDRDYVRKRPSDGGGGFRRPGRGFHAARVMSVNGWLIIINVAIYFVAVLFLPILYQLGYFSTAKALFFVNSANQTVFSLQVWRLITFQFLHDPGNIWHLFFNMFGLWVFGGMVEEVLGRKRYLAFYLVCGIFGGVAYMFLNLLEGVFNIPIPGAFDDPTMPLIGASAGVFGVIMACAYIAPNAVVQLLIPPIPLKLKWFAYGYVGIAAFFLITGSNNAGGEAAHLGGAIAGFFFIRNAHLLRDFFDVFADSRKPKRDRGAKPKTKEPGWGRRVPSQAEVDRILAKVGTEGIHSLTGEEKKTLREATEAERRPR